MLSTTLPIMIISGTALPGCRANSASGALGGRKPLHLALQGEDRATAGEGGPMEVASGFAQLQLRFVDQVQWRYELIRPLVLLEERPTPPEAIRQRAHATGSHPETVRKFTRRFEQQGLPGLLPEAVAVVPKGPAPRVPPEVVAEIGRLKALYEGFQYQELVRIILCTCRYRMTDK